jgi:hypothetical protein
MQEWENMPTQDQIDNWYGFVYKITRLNALEGEPKFYIGCKKLKSIRRLPPLKGTKRKRTSVKKSDYETYYGSSNELLKDIEKYGKENFKREVLKMCTCQWQLKYEELWYQIKEDAIIKNEYYNAILNVRIGRPPKSLSSYYKNIL